MDQQLQAIWEEEHKTQVLFNRMHSSKPSEGLEAFQRFLERSNISIKRVLDLGCGKGRNSIYLAQKGYDVVGLDFSKTAIASCNERKSSLPNIQFLQFDISKPLPFQDQSFDAILDINTTVCILEKARRSVINESHRILRRSGYYFFYGIGPSTIHRDPGPEINSGLLPKTKCFEKQYSKDELLWTYTNFIPISLTIEQGQDKIQNEKTTYSMWNVIFQKR